MIHCIELAELRAKNDEIHAVFLDGFAAKMARKSAEGWRKKACEMTADEAKSDLMHFDAVNFAVSRRLAAARREA